MRGSHFALLTVKAALKGFRLMILLEIDREDDDFSVLLVGKSGRLKRVSIEPNSHLAHFLGEISPAQGDRGRTHVLPPPRSRFVRDLNVARCALGVSTNSDYELTYGTRR